MLFWSDTLFSELLVENFSLKLCLPPSLLPLHAASEKRDYLEQVFVPLPKYRRELMPLRWMVG